MRLGQFAKNHDLSVKEIVEYIESLHLKSQSVHPNAKLREETQEKVLDHFGISLYTPKKSESEPSKIPDAEPKKATLKTPSIEENKSEKELSAAEEIAAIGGEVVSNEFGTEPKNPTPEPQGEKETGGLLDIPNETKEEEVILSDQLLEMLDSDEQPANLDKIKLIKAPKRELSGLKVLGKVDLPEPIKKEPKTVKKTETNRSPKNQLSEEEKEKRRLRTKRKKEAYEARQQKRKEAQEAERLKKLRTAHYQENVAKKQQPRTTQPKPESEDTQTADSHLSTAAGNTYEKKPPKTLIGKVWKWLNT